MCQVHTGAYVSRLTPGETDYNACHPRKTTTYIRIFTWYLSNRVRTTDTTSQLEKRNEEKERDKGKERKAKKAKQKKVPFIGSLLSCL